MPIRTCAGDLRPATAPVWRLRYAHRFRLGSWADAALVRTVAAVLADTGLEPDALWLEITESTVMADAQGAASGALADLGRLGRQLVQGYHVGPPLPPGQAREALRAGPRLGATARR